MLFRSLRTLEDALLGALATLGIEGRRIAGRTGVWTSDTHKIASIGVAVRRWVGYHGFALNVENTLDPFAFIHPCGLQGIRMTSVAETLGPGAPSLAQVRATVTAELVARLGYDGVVEVGPDAVHEAAGIAPPIVAS